MNEVRKENEVISINITRLVLGFRFVHQVEAVVRSYLAVQ